jgi:hypothetical protein
MKKVHVKILLGEMIAPLLIRLGVDIDDIPSYVFGDKIDEPLPGDPLLTTRVLLQAQGCGFLDELPDPMIAQRLVVNEVGAGIPVVVESVRYAREAEWLRANGFLLVRIIRPSYLSNAPGMDHKSEHDQIFSVDYTIANDGTLSQLLDAISTIATTCGFEPIAACSRVPRLVLVNGRPRVGKDTFVEYATSYIRRRFNWPTDVYSSIDPVREALKAINVDVSAKDAKDRDLLSEMGAALEKHCGFRSFRTMQVIQSTFFANGTAFVYVREAYMMDKIEQQIHKAAMAGLLPHVLVSKLWVTRMRATDLPQPTNHSDDIDGTEVEYDWQVVNNGTLDDLRELAIRFVDALLSGRESGYFTPLHSPGTLADTGMCPAISNHAKAPVNEVVNVDYDLAGFLAEVKEMFNDDVEHEVVDPTAANAEKLMNNVGDDAIFDKPFYGDDYLLAVKTALDEKRHRVEDTINRVEDVAFSTQPAEKRKKEKRDPFTTYIRSWYRGFGGFGW